ncbi:MAG: NHL repeat containing protein, partial [Candidatus Moranbacteria bacterium GW2011_GWF1_35_5]
MKLKQIILGIFLIAIFLISSFPTNVEATSTTQDDWSGGPGQIIQNDETKFNQEEGEGLYIEDGLKMKINADTVVGQDNFDNTAPNSADPRSNGLYTPRSSIIINNKLFIIDTNNHRILIYNTIPTTDGVAADVVIGQTDFLTATSGTSSTKLKNPSGIYSDGTKLFVSDMSNNRILIYNTIPTTNGV